MPAKMKGEGIVGIVSVCQKKVGGLKNGETRPFDTRSIHL